MVGGSDWPVSSANPLEAIEVMVRRQDPSAGPGLVLGHDEELSLPTALAAYTVVGARLLGHDADVGTLREGALADLVVLDHTLDAAAPEGLSDARPWLTLLGGVAVHRAVEAAAAP